MIFIASGDQLRKGLNEISSLKNHHSFFCLADGIQICHRAGKDMNVCLATAIEGALHFLKDGLILHSINPLTFFSKQSKTFLGSPALNIVSIDPYRIDFAMATHTAGNTNFNLKSSLKDVDVRGLVEFTKVLRVATKFDKKFGLKTETQTENLEISGDYTMNGQILVLPIRGIGKTNITLTDVTTLVDIRGDYIMKDGDTYIDVTSLKIKLKPKRARFYFENIFNGDKVLSETINKFMDENWEVVANTLLPDYEILLGERFKAVSNNIFRNVPMKMIFPE